MLPKLLGFACLLVHTVVHSTGWGYSDENGPENWVGHCQGGLRQSPIDIRSGDVEFAMLHRLHYMHYDHSGTVNVSNNGHTISVSGFDRWGAKRPYIQGGGLQHRYKLSQFHLHWSHHDHTGSEHKIHGLHYPAELHLVHVRTDLTLSEAMKRPDGLAVVGVFIVIEHDSAPFSAIADTLEQLIHPGNVTTVRGLRLFSLLPPRYNSFYRYEGSLTTPGCNEVVLWTVLAEPISITRKQMRDLRNIRGLDGELPRNYRSVQHLNGRRIQFRPEEYDRNLLCGVAAANTASGLVLLAIFANLYN